MFLMISIIQVIRMITVFQDKLHIIKSLGFTNKPEIAEVTWTGFTEEDIIEEYTIYLHQN